MGFSLGLTWGLIAAYSALAGAWASRCNILILVPLIATAIPFLALIGLARGESWDEVAVDITVTIAGLQAGYIAMIFASVLIEPLAQIVRARAPVWRPRRQAVLAAPAACPAHPDRQRESAAGDRRRWRKSDVE